MFVNDNMEYSFQTIANRVVSVFTKAAGYAKIDEHVCRTRVG